MEEGEVPKRVLQYGPKGRRDHGGNTEKVKFIKVETAIGLILELEEKKLLAHISNFVMFRY
jgi:hypothetical protein